MRPWSFLVGVAVPFLLALGAVVGPRVSAAVPPPRTFPADFDRLVLVTGDARFAGMVTVGATGQGEVVVREASESGAEQVRVHPLQVRPERLALLRAALAAAHLEDVPPVLPAPAGGGARCFEFELEVQGAGRRLATRGVIGGEGPWANDLQRVRGVVAEILLEASRDHRWDCPIGSR